MFMKQVNSISKKIKSSKTSEKLYRLFPLVIILLGLFVLWPSFLLHFDGDSYLTLWRYQLNAEQNKELAFPFISTFFTDYGPQDTMFATLYNIFGLRPVYFYIVSFLLRLFAAFSLLPLLLYLTKNKFASYFSVMLFLITPVGLETTNWVFNMPSYLAITFLNIFLLLYLKLLDNVNFKHYFLSLIVFFILIIIQPIRMVFVFPFLMLSGFLITLFKKVQLKKIILIHLTYIILFLLIFTFGNIGDSVGVKGTPLEKIKGEWIDDTFVGSGGLTTSIKKKDTKVVYYYIGQLGNIVFPNQLLPKLPNTPNSTSMALKYILPILLTYCMFIYSIKYFNRHRLYIFLTALFWSSYTWWIFHYKAIYPMQIYEILPIVVGGYFIIFFAFMLHILIKHKSKSVNGLIVGILIILFSYFVPWVRSPSTLIPTEGRYLIAGAAGLSIVVGLVFSLFRKEKLIIIAAIAYLFLCGKSSFLYLKDLFNNRGYSITENIRSSIPNTPQFKQTKEPVVVYLESDNEKQLYHSLYFGFPVMMHYYQGVENIWNVAYTTNWEEVVSAYQTGEGFKRFGTITIKPANINFIFSFKLENNIIIDTTSQTRSVLNNIKNL